MSREPASTSLAAIVRRLRNPEAWIWKGAITDWLADGFNMMFAPSSSKKSFIAVDWTVHVAAGLPVGPYAVRQGAVIYIAAEDKAGVEQRLAAAAEAIEVSFDIPVHVIEPPCRIDDPKFPDLLIGRIRSALGDDELAVAMIVIDTLRSACAGSLNDDLVAAAVANHLIAVADRLGSPSVLAIHHTGKEEAPRRLGADRADGRFQASRPAVLARADDGLCRGVQRRAPPVARQRDPRAKQERAAPGRTLAGDGADRDRDRERRYRQRRCSRSHDRAPLRES